ncbi:Glucan 1,4-alpha-glucosidase SusB [Sphingomonas sp. EC-HK361]|uniref:glycoside hydrolase family 97 protein n=1 Tax=Sphingomonas sp. EC-HK361 TaxID=2038397 RepID=UPI001253C7FE|nr:glycoside hydrolase family 97 protein [Sphingomonas sp. EC-HK361]VVT12814.1 Glucan 1,4-alpha-glucosidase SusB [Sphingomonas sp. EC-HK361]
MKLSGRTVLSLIALITATPALADVVASAKSPNGKIAVSVSLDPEGHATYAVTRNGKPVINDSRLGFLFTDAPKIERNMTFLDAKTAKFDQTWKQPWGEWSQIRDNHVELKVRLKEAKDLKREMDVTFRLFDDGIGFRYEMPDQPNLKTAHIADELTEFALAQDGTAWWIPAGEWNRYEYLYNKTPITSVGQAHTPVTMKLADGTYIAFHEAALVDYSSMWLRHVEGTKFKATLAPGATAAKVTKAGAFTTPWRTMILSDDAPGLYMSHIELNLNEPNKLGDVSWFKPSKYVGVWWEMHIDKSGWGGPNVGATTDNVKKYIDFAAANGFPGVLVEGWNVGWDSDWFGNGNAFDFATPQAKFDMPTLSAYASAKGVHLIGHHETGGSASHYESQLDRAYAYAASNGEQVVKTGYVADAGQMERVDPDGTHYREWHDGQWSSNHHLRVIETAAKYHVAVDTHEPIKDTGLRRTYPNWVSREGARGMEYNAWGVPKNPPEHEANLVFTRMLSGPMDFTPGVLSLTGKGGTPIQSTIAKQLALYVVLYSPVQMAADLPENYAKYPEAFQFIKDVPADWSDTRVLNGEVGDYVTFARKDKNSDDWYLGAVGDEQPRTSQVKLDFLDRNRSYTAEIYRDGPGANYRTEARHSITIEKMEVAQGQTITVALAPGGGEAIRFVAGKKGKPGKKRK